MSLQPLAARAVSLVPSSRPAAAPLRAGVRALAAAGLVAALALAGGCDDARKARSSVGALEPSLHVVSFGATTLGLPVVRDVTLTQRGRLAAEITGSRLDPDEGVFQLTHLPTLVDRDEESLLEVTYRPTVAGTHKAVLELTLRDGDTVKVALDGRGVDARAVPDQGVNFGRPALGAVRRRTLTLRNDQETPVPVTLAMKGVDAREFAVTPALTVPPFSTVTANLRYEPQGRSGFRDAQLELVACPLCLPQRLPVTADAVPQPIVADPEPVDLGSVQIDSEKSAQVTLTNATDELITVESIALGDGDEGWKLDPVSAPLALLPLTPETVTVHFTPTKGGPAKGAFVVASDAEPTPQRLVAMQAQGGGSQLVVAPMALDFRTVPAQGRQVLPVTISNGGADPAAPPLHVTGLGIAGQRFSIAQGFATPRTLAAGERVVVQLAFEPDQAGDFSGTFTVRSDDPLAPEVNVALVGKGSSTADCQLEVVPPAIDFGGVQAQKGATLGARIVNVGQSVCSLWDGQVVGDSAFTLARARTFVQLNPGDAVMAPVAFRPPALGRYGAVVRFQTSRAAQPELAIPLTGGSDASCLRPEPTFLDFGTRRNDCGPAEQVATWRNACNHPIAVTDISFGPGTDADSFQLLSHTALPRTLGPGEKVEASVRFTPQKPGYVLWPLFAQADDQPLPLLVSLSGETLDNALHDEHYVQPMPAKVDLLWVIDNTASMADERGSLSRSIAHFLQTADQRGIDYHVGVTTTGITPAPTQNNTERCPGGVDGGEAGRLFPVDHSRARIVDPAMPDRAATLAQNVAVGGCHNVEQGFQAAELALSPPLVDNADHPRTPEPLDGNLGFVRADAQLAVIVVSDEDDKSPGSVKEHVQILRGLKPTTPMTFSAIVAPLGGCASAVEPGARYLEAVAALGGVAASVCEADWSQSLDQLADGLFRVKTDYVLAAGAEQGSLVVTLDGQRSSAWTYDAATHTVRFSPAPAPGTDIRIQYREPCP